LLVVGAKTVTMGVRIREKTRLEDGIGGRLKVRNDVRRGECDLGKSQF
jgi:hypothetical protein